MMERVSRADKVDSSSADGDVHAESQTDPPPLLEPDAVSAGYAQPGSSHDGRQPFPTQFGRKDLTEVPHAPVTCLGMHPLDGEQLVHRSVPLASKPPCCTDYSEGHRVPVEFMGNPAVTVPHASHQEASASDRDFWQGERDDEVSGFRTSESRYQVADGSRYLSESQSPFTSRGISIPVHPVAADWQPYSDDGTGAPSLQQGLASYPPSGVGKRGTFFI
jgi:hypothetical protein